MILQGWQHVMLEEIKVYEKIEAELTVVKCCVVRGNRVIIPTFI